MDGISTEPRRSKRVDAAASDAVVVSVIIPAFNEELWIGQTIDSVVESFRNLDYEAFEIVVCDNNSTDATAQIATSKGARVIFEPHNQISKARNAAAAEARGEWLIFLDADTTLNSSLLSETVDAFHSGKSCGGGAVIEFERTGVGHFATGVTWLWNRLSATFNVAAGSYLFCRRQAWVDVEGFDESVYAAEELFFSRKIKRWGKPRKLRFQVLTKSPITTSARKMEWYGPWQILWRVILMARPGALNRRDMCGLWYSRPESSEDKKRSA